MGYIAFVIVHTVLADMPSRILMVYIIVYKDAHMS